MRDVKKRLDVRVCVCAITAPVVCVDTEEAAKEDVGLSLHVSRYYRLERDWREWLLDCSL